MRCRWLLVVVGLGALILFAPSPVAADHEPMPDACRDPVVIKGSPNITASWCALDHFGVNDVDPTRVKAHHMYGTHQIHLNQNFTYDQFPTIGHETILHELAHTMDYRHGEGGVVNIEGNRTDRTTCGIHPITRTVADNYEGFRVIDWTLRDLQYLINEWAHDRIETDHMQWAIDQWASESECPTVYYTHEIEDVFAPGLIGHSTAGHFYGYEAGRDLYR